MNIKTLKIFTSNFEAQIDFYHKTLGLNLLGKNTSEARFQIGKSELFLCKSANSQAYHFAINIPSNQENKALKWLQERVSILKNGEQEIQDFDFWNAKAIYFYDRDQNIVEFIARKNLKNDSQASFTQESLIEISEIGMPVNDIESIYLSLQGIVPLEKYDGSFDRFCAIGDENGLFICINKQLKDWFPAGDKAFSSEFKIQFQEQGKAYAFIFKDGIIEEC